MSEITHPTIKGTPAFLDLYQHPALPELTETPQMAGFARSLACGLARP